LTTNDALRRACETGWNPQAFAVHDELHPYASELADQVAGLITRMMADPTQDEEVVENDLARSSRRADQRMLERFSTLGAEVVTGGEVIKPEPKAGWNTIAKTAWVLASEDEASARWGSGDWLQLFIACEYVTRLFQRGKRPPADGVRVLFDILNGLQLSDTAKRRTGLLVDRSGASGDDQYAAELAAMAETPVSDDT
jgi:hypothetical protein